jgi:hypothetical protein
MRLERIFNETLRINTFHGMLRLLNNYGSFAEHNEVATQLPRACASGLWRDTSPRCNSQRNGSNVTIFFLGAFVFAAESLARPGRSGAARGSHLLAATSAPSAWPPAAKRGIARIESLATLAGAHD